MKQTRDIWILESNLERAASDALNVMYVVPALKGDRSAQQYLSRLWEERWSSVKEKLETEGSGWYVWWMDGIREFIRKRYRSA